MVGPGMAVCATHVIRPHIEALTAGTGSCYCVGLSQRGTQIWEVRKGTPVPHSDLTILGLRLRSSLPADRTFNLAHLTTRLPMVGEHLTVMGFRATGVEGIQLGTFVAKGNVLVSVGEVTERYPRGRDRVMLPWPSVEVNCRAWGGMSGGPAFDSRGFVIGLVCSSVSDSSGASTPTFLSLLWPALAAQYEGGWPEALFQGRRSLLDVDTRVCSIERREAMSVQRGATGHTWSCQHWS